jgi:transposase
MDTMQDFRKLPRQRYGAELKAQILSECEQPGASVARVAMSHGVNANVVHKWRRLAHADAATGTVPAFIPVALPAPASPVAQDIRIELRRGATAMTITWPVAAADDCAAWIRELLR